MSAPERHPPTTDGGGTVTYGGQAVLEGVMMRGRRWAAVAVRAPSGRIVVRSERLPVRRAGGRIARVPLLRGLVVLRDSLGLGMRALRFSALVLEGGEDAEATAGLEGPRRGASSAVPLLLALAAFFLLPFGLALLIGLATDARPVVHALEGLIRLLLLVGYVWAVGRVPEIQRVFAYHGAEHMTIHAFEAGDPLDVEHIRRYPPPHPRCGTAFLLLVAILAGLVFPLIPSDDWLAGVGGRILGIPIVVGLAYEVLKLGGAHAGRPLGRLVAAPGIALQALTTRQPEPEMIVVAVAAFEEMRRLELSSAPSEPAPPAGGLT